MKLPLDITLKMLDINRLFEAIDCNDIAYIKKFFKEDFEKAKTSYNENLNISDIRKKTPRKLFTLLSYAISKGKKEIVEVLIEKGADLDLASPLSESIEAKQIDILELLLIKKADPNLPDFFMLTPLHNCCMRVGQ